MTDFIKANTELRTKLYNSHTEKEAHSVFCEIDRLKTEEEAERLKNHSLKVFGIIYKAQNDLKQLYCKNKFESDFISHLCAKAQILNCEDFFKTDFKTFFSGYLWQSYRENNKIDDIFCYSLFEDFRKKLSDYIFQMVNYQEATR